MIRSRIRFYNRKGTAMGNQKIKITGVTKKEIAYQLWLRDPKVNRNQVSRCLNINLRTVYKYFEEFEQLQDSKPDFGKSNAARVSKNEANNILKSDLSDTEKKFCDPTADVVTEDQMGEDLDEFKIEADIKPGKTSSTTVFGKTLDKDPSSDDIIKLAIAKAGINPECWDVGPCKVSFWHTSMKVRYPDKRNKNGYLHRVIRVTNWSVKITLIPNRTPFVLNAVRKLVDTFPPLPPVSFPKTNSNYAGALAPVDIHFGKFAWNDETMCGHMDLKIAKNVFIDSCTKNLRDMAKFPLSKIYVIVGHDLMHFENYAAETPKGRHHLDVDGRLPKAIKTTKESFIQIVDMAMQIAPVEIIRVPGNHDMHASYWLVELMRERYRNNKHVTVDNGVYSDSPYKLIKWGNLIVGMMHNVTGNRVPRAINAVPQFWRTEWGESRYSELWVGHLHKKQDTKIFPVNSVGSTLIRQLSALCTNDFWHFDELWVDAVPACESFILDKSDGVVANFKRNIDYMALEY